MPLLKSHHTAHISKAPAIQIKHTHTHGSQAKTQLCGLKIIKIILHRCKPTCSFCRKKHPLGFAPSGCLIFIKFFMCLLVRISVRILLLPAPAVLAHFLDISFRFPAKLFVSLARVGIANCKVACAPGHDFVFDINAGGFFECVHNIKHAVALARAEVVDENSFFAFNLLNRFNMAERESTT